MTKGSFKKMAAKIGSHPTSNMEYNDSFKNLVSNDYTKNLRGIIKTIFIRNNTVFIIAERDHSDISSRNPDSQYTVGSLHGEHSLFNAKPYEDADGLTLAELAIPTDIDPANNTIERFIGSPVLVEEQDGIAIFASLVKGSPQLTSIHPSIIRRIRDAVEKNYNGEDTKPTSIFDRALSPLWALFGVVQEDLEDLKKLQYRKDEYSNKILTIEGEGVWTKDVSGAKYNEVILPVNNLFQDLNQEGMKDNQCHNPTIIFSAK